MGLRARDKKRGRPAWPQRQCAHVPPTTILAVAVLVAALPAASRPAECNPTRCPRGLTCHVGTKCGGEHNMFACGPDVANIQYCPSGFHQCANGFCAVLPQLCEELGGVVRTNQLCNAPAPSIVCQMRPADGCDVTKAYCQEVELPFCVELEDFRVFIDPAAATVSAYTSSICFNPLFGQAQPVRTKLVRDGCTTLGVFATTAPSSNDLLVPPAAQWMLRVFEPGEACPDCRMAKYVDKEAQGLVTCSSLVSRTACSQHADTCIWSGLEGSGCTTLDSFYFLTTEQRFCTHFRRSAATCVKFPQCNYTAEAGCHAPRYRGAASDAFELEMTFAPDQFKAADNAFMAETGQRFNLWEMNECNVVPGVTGLALQFGDWGQVRVEPRPDARTVGSNFHINFVASASQPHEIDELGDPAGCYSGQRFVLGPSPEQAVATSPPRDYLAISLGTNGLSLYHYNPDTKACAAVLVHEGEYLPNSWHAFGVSYVAGRPDLHIDGPRAPFRTLLALPNSSDIPTTAAANPGPTAPAPAALGNTTAAPERRSVVAVLDRVGRAFDGQFSGRLTSVDFIDFNYYPAWGSEVLLERLVSVSTSFINIRGCTLAYGPASAPREKGFVTTAKSRYASAAPTVSVLRESVDGQLAPQLLSRDLTFELIAGPPGLEVGPRDGVLSGVFARNGTFAVEVIARHLNSTCVASLATTLSVLPPLELTADPATLQLSATVEAPYDVSPSYRVGGGGLPVLFSATGLPRGLHIVPATGQFTGAPSGTAGLYNVSIRATDPHGAVASTSFELEVDEPIAVLQESIVVTSGFAFRVAAPRISGGRAVGPGQDYRYRVSKGSLPVGVSLDNATGAIVGLPRQEGSFAFTLAVADGNGGEASLLKAIVVRPTLRVAFEPLGALSLSAFHLLPEGAFHLVVSGGTPPYSVTFPGLPGFAVEPAQLASTPPSHQRFVLVGTTTEALSVSQPLVQVEDAGNANVSLPFADSIVIEQATSGDDLRLVVISVCLVGSIAFLLSVMLCKWRRDRLERARPYDFRFSRYARACNGKPLIFPKELKPKHLHNEKLIGKGAFGTVSKFFHASAHAFVAIKEPLGGVLDVPSPKKDAKKGPSAPKPTASQLQHTFRVSRELLMSEVLLQTQLSHRNIVAVRGVVTCRDYGWAVLEYCDLGSLSANLRLYGVREKPLFLQMALDISSGMHYIRQHGIVHCDLACRNILLTSDSRCKICDFGLAHHIQDAKADYYRGSPQDLIPVRWAAPEVIQGKLYSHASDVWSFGICLYEMMTGGQTPYEEFQHGNAVRRALSNRTPMTELLPRPAGASGLFHELCLQCWNWEPAMRPTFDQLRELFDTHCMRNPVRSSVTNRTLASCSEALSPLLMANSGYVSARHLIGSSAGQDQSQGYRDGRFHSATTNVDTGSLVLPIGAYQGPGAPPARGRPSHGTSAAREPLASADVQLGVVAGAANAAISAALTTRV